MQEDDPVAGEDPVAGTFKERVLADPVYFSAEHVSPFRMPLK